MISFYSENPGNLIPSLSNKLHLGLNPFPYLWILMLTMILEIIRRKLPDNGKMKKVVTPLMLILTVIAMAALLMNSDHRFNPSGNIFGNQLLPQFMTIAMVAFFSITSLITFFGKEQKALEIPLVCFLIIMNFIFLTLVFYGSVRFIKVADFAFVFFALLLPVKWLFDWKPAWAQKITIE